MNDLYKGAVVCHAAEPAGSVAIMSHAFLSPEWISAARSIREKYADEATAVATAIRMNQIITGSPFGAAPIEIFVDTSSGIVELDFGSLDAPDLVVTTDYDTARSILVEQDAAAAMQAFMSGRIKVQGDMTKMMGLQVSMSIDEIAKQISEEIRDITA